MIHESARTSYLKALYVNQHQGLGYAYDSFEHPLLTVYTLRQTNDPKICFGLSLPYIKANIDNPAFDCGIHSMNIYTTTIKKCIKSTGFRNQNTLKIHIYTIKQTSD